jgi:hypothetical protein
MVDSQQSQWNCLFGGDNTFRQTAHVEPFAARTSATVLMWTAPPMEQWNDNVFKALRAGCLHVNALYGGETLLHRAAAQGRVDVMKALHYEFHAALDVVDKAGWTMLMKAVAYQWPDAVQWLVQQPSTPLHTKTMYEKKTALDIARHCYNAAINHCVEAAMRARDRWSCLRAAWVSACVCRPMPDVVVGPTPHTCPITLEPIAVAACSEVGSVYEMAALAASADLARDPLTGEPLPHWPAFRYVAVEPSLLSMHARLGTVNTALRTWCVENLVKPTLALAAIKDPEPMIRRALFMWLAAAGKASSLAERMDALKNAAMLLKSYNVAIPNADLADWLSCTEKGRVLQSVLKVHGEPRVLHTECGLGAVLLFMCKEPSNDGFGLLKLLGPDTYCYHGKFGRKLPPKEELELLQEHRENLWKIFRL